MASVLLVGPSSVGNPLALLAQALRDGGATVATSHMPDSPAAAFALLQNVTTLVILPETTDVGQRTWLDTASRGTYDLLGAACDTLAARHVIILSTLDLFCAYPAAFKIGADW